jgi:hypothetical protein
MLLVAVLGGVLPLIAVRRQQQQEDLHANRVAFVPERVLNEEGVVLTRTSLCRWDLGKAFVLPGRDLGHGWELTCE